VSERDRRIHPLVRQQQAERAADGEAATDHDHVPAGDRHVVAPQHLEEAGGSAGQGRVKVAADPEHEPAEVGRVQPVGILGRIHQLEHRVLVDARGQWQLDDVAGHGQVLIKAKNGGPHLVFGRLRRKIHPDRLDAELDTVAMLTGHVGERSRIAAHKQCAETGMDAAGLERGDAADELVLDCRRGGDTVHAYCGHCSIPVPPDVSTSHARSEREGAKSTLRGVMGGQDQVPGDTRPG
jgi:hypothetical protein